MHRRFILLCFCIILPLTISLRTSAHSGRTDDSGGHTDRSTGEYHYHHGYSAHDHWDMDGDGDLDCPYEYTAPTKQEGNEYISPNIDTNGIPTSNVNLSSQASNTTKNNANNNAHWIFCIISILIAIAVIIIKKKAVTTTHPKNIFRDKTDKVVLPSDRKETITNTVVDTKKSHLNNNIKSITCKHAHLNPSCVKVTEEYLIDIAIEMGVSLVTALKIINLERRCEGLPPLTNTEEDVINY